MHGYNHAQFTDEFTKALRIEGLAQGCTASMKELRLELRALSSRLGFFLLMLSL